MGPGTRSGWSSAPRRARRSATDFRWCSCCAPRTRPRRSGTWGRTFPQPPAGRCPHAADWGPDLAAEALRRLAAAPERPAGEALLDQRNLAGIGNVYANELCFLAGVTPWTAFGELPAPERLVALAHRLLFANRLRPGHPTTGELRPDRAHWVYGRAGRPCRRCGSTIRTASQGVAPQQRVAYWCPRCQPGPSPDG